MENAIKKFINYSPNNKSTQRVLLFKIIHKSSIVSWFL